MSADPETMASAAEPPILGDDRAMRGTGPAVGLERGGMAWPVPDWERPSGVWRPDAWLPPPPDVFAPAIEPEAIALPAIWPPAIGPDATDGAARPNVGGARLVREALETMVMAGVMLVVLLTLVRNYKIEGTSMAPTLAPAEYILVSKLAYRGFGDPARGDIIVFLDWNNQQDYIKRVIGLPGESVDVHDGAVWIDGARLDEPYLNGVPTGGGGGPRTLGEKEYYVLGDNRGNSSDSRIHGPLPRDHIVGRAWLTYWPLGLFGWIGRGQGTATSSG
ncbi:MAG: signal peptidase I [Ardenticatenales bacterium]